MYHLYVTITGEYLGQSKLRSNFPDSLPVNSTLIQLPDGDESGIWNTLTRSFDSRPEVLRVISARRFLSLLTEAEQKGIILLAKTNDNAELFLTKLKILDGVEVGPYLQNGLNFLESLGILASGRAAEIFNGA